MRSHPKVMLDESGSVVQVLSCKGSVAYQQQLDGEVVGRVERILSDEATN